MRRTTAARAARWMAAALFAVTAAHAVGMARAFALPDAFAPTLGTGAPTEAMGYAIPACLVAQLGGIDPSTFDRVRCGHVAWLLTGREAPVGGPGSGTPPSDVFRVQAVDWATDEAMNTSIVPADVVAAIVREAGRS